jgi:flagellar biosynthesis/type III secretory pathway chaperone
MENYLKILEDSLLKKCNVLDEISEYNEEQYRIFSQESVDLDKFDEYVEQKGKLIDSLTKLDDGFETLFARVSEELSANRSQYTEQIARLQTLVREVTDKGVSVQAQEARNKALIEEYFAKERRNLHNNRKTAKAAYNYYKTMSGINSVPPQYLDSKQ